jgi:hypothetical protein
MDTRDERIARNEARLRAVNEEIEQISVQELETGKHGTIEVLCECGQDGCHERIQLSIAEYEAAHDEEDRFVVVPGHEDAEIERVAERTDRYLIVDKFGEAEDIVEQSG